jgi:hypothetical protein
MNEYRPRMGLFWSIILGQIWPSVEPIFTILSITSSFLIHFLLVKYLIEGLDMLFSVVRKWSIKSCFWPGHGLGQTWSTLVNFSQLWSNLSKPHELCPRPCSKKFLMHFSHSRVELGQSNYLVLYANT